MTIKFECFADNYMCKDYYYRIWNDTKPAVVLNVTMDKYEFEKLFKQMAEELKYIVLKRPSEELENLTDNQVKGNTRFKSADYNDDEFKLVSVKVKAVTKDREDLLEEICRNLRIEKKRIKEITDALDTKIIDIERGMNISKLSIASDMTKIGRRLEVIESQLSTTLERDDDNIYEE